MAHDQFGAPGSPEEVPAHDGAVMCDLRQGPRAGVISELQIRHPHVKHSVQQRARLHAAVGVGLPDKAGVGRQERNKFERGRQMHRRLAAQQHDGARAAVQGRHRAPGGRAGVKGRAGPGIPAIRAGNAKRAPQIAAVQGDGESGDQFQFVGDFGLRGEEAGLGAGVTQPGGAGLAVGATFMRTKAARGQHRARLRGIGPRAFRTAKAQGGRGFGVHNSNLRRAGARPSGAQPKIGQPEPAARHHDDRGDPAGHIGRCEEACRRQQNHQLAHPHFNRGRQHHHLMRE